ncbi:Dehydrogenase/reductase SDR family member 4 (NADPH-dependent carbonyl reductase/NADP-retinol dehydrogenase) (CR) (PHCR) (NADPH-dependent retinol dehydrogenase/reductase) (NRDR) (humNRDR) (Peroxisomal short-chain alcohol dehydrogenase) (PSCD) (SCAD-SRL) (Short chain dehydrogenase/reductase family 25C member 2) (Short-chain dehydrogenase/reductase family member 4) [Durusdinium trenchii]|uniref:3-oxoacyl-[acyl-carrier-protein] reductase n=1 Tax=Durusdinium trenchii TaxID=1381693 RepID=A0ABP0NMW9_9DINO
MTRVLVTDAAQFLGAALCRALPGTLPECQLFLQDASFAEGGARDEFLTGLGDVGCKVELVGSRDVGEVVDAVRGDVDVLINNTAYPAHKRKFEDVSREAFVEALTALTVFPFELTAKLLPRMKERKAGKVIFITSATAFRGLPNYSSYVIGRGATNAMALTLAHEVAPFNIQVNAVAPNFIESPTYFPQHLLDDPKIHAKIVKPIPLGRLGKPEEPADFIAFLASEKANFITGQLFPFAGGWA